MNKQLVAQVRSAETRADYETYVLRQERKCLLAQLAIQEHENQLLESLYAQTTSTQVPEEDRAESADSGETSGVEAGTTQET
jgi:hypothetical protein